MILVVSHPPSDEAYWVSVKDYFKGWTLGNPTAVTFKKSEQRFNKDSFRALAAIAAPKAGLCLALVRVFRSEAAASLRAASEPDPARAANDSRFLDAVGPSGHPLSSHYDDFLGDWQAVRHRKMRMERADIEKGAVGRLRLVPQ